MTITGIDLGNYSTKTSNRVNFLSKVSKEGNLLNNTKVLTTQKGIFYLGEGNFDGEYRKIKKQYLKEMFIAAVALSSAAVNNKVVVGLPLSQYTQDKEALKHILLSDKMHDINMSGADRKINIEDVTVYPEGVAALVGSSFNGVICDIGGRTTDCALIEGRKVTKPYSLAVGTLNLYADFIKLINSKYGLDLRTDDATRILQGGLEIYGEPQNIDFAMEVFKSYVTTIVNELKINYSIKTLKVKLIGGGAQLLAGAFKKRIPNAELIDDTIFANALGFGDVGAGLWQ
jgi:plasmid segregation protein ParM